MQNVEKNFGSKCEAKQKAYEQSVAHYTSQKAKYGGLFLSTKIKDLSYIFSLVAKSDMQVSCVIF